MKSKEFRNLKKVMNSKVDKYLIDGCMRCKFGATPKCKVNNWKAELQTLRQVVLESGLTEDLKWGVPCYTSGNKNIVMISAFKNHACLTFFKGVLLKDKEKILLKAGENSQSFRIIKYTNFQQIIEQAEIIKSYISEAVAIEQSGQKVVLRKNPESIPYELLKAFDNDPEFKRAFYALTPGRQRGYIIYFSQPKQTQTKTERIEKYKKQIINGVGLNDKYSC
ncbi:MAG TPA: DUF1801 domain-containing protein [Chitinophagaceae bacterium]|nr:DUF1801 domain-containing protein [Chitinophagaceae bacterium]